jgi:hypothetical protein
VYKVLRATFVITPPLPSLENSSKRDGAQPKKTFKSGTFVLLVHSLGTAGGPVSTAFRSRGRIDPVRRSVPAWHAIRLGYDSRSRVR